MKNGGWWHPYNEAIPKEKRFRPKPMKTEPEINCGQIMQKWNKETTAAHRAQMSLTLGVKPNALRWLGTAWAQEREAIAFPMYDATCPDGERPCGIRLRTNDGKKFAVTGSKSGIFFPYGALLEISSSRIFICEGPTDTGSCLDLGCFAVGRASCRGGEDIILSVLNQLRPTEAVIVCDNDGPGIDGANVLMEQIRIRKTMFVPPGKDIRGYINDGGTKPVLDAMLKNLAWK